MTKYQSFAGRFRMLSSAPSGGVDGDIYYDTTINQLVRYDGTAWRATSTFTTTSTSSSTSTSTTTTA